MPLEDLVTLHVKIIPNHRFCDRQADEMENSIVWELIIEVLVYAAPISEMLKEQ